jgi:WD40 repeat protein
LNRDNRLLIYILLLYTQFLYPGASWYIASGGVDTTVQVWKATDGCLVFKYAGHTAEVESITWSPNSKRVASAGDDQTVQVWQVQ